ncbi:coiled-coil domain-containing protein 96 [Melanotaenia boesemani]|uniref:coiled-coil domain-containing protein 96 n=1 Tax=Melanotaenia boesemani TaxID=1250792 RepID=UPI001C05B1FD|nr:coiled-coil domain-containing protein 96 [Melanotaenia boesemani]
MDREPQHEENNIHDTKKETLEEDTFVDGNEKEELVLSDYEEEPKKENLDVKTHEVNEPLLSRDQSVVFEVDSSGDGEPSRLNLETQSPACEKEREATAAAADKEDSRYEESIQLFQELCEERDKVSQQNRQLQLKLADFLSKKARGDSQLEEKPETEQLQEYKKCISILNDLRQQLAADSESAQQQAEELSLQSQEKLDRVENEWRALVELKRDAAVSALSRRLGKEAAQAKVDAVLKAEQLRQDELIKMRLKHFKLVFKIGRLEAELREEEEHGRDPLQIQFEQLQAKKLEQKKLAEKENEESLKLQKKISVCLEVLSNIKEKLYWSQMEVQAKREQLAKVEAMVARKKDLLTRTKQARNSLQRDNRKLKERCGLLGNRVLLRDFEDTVDASNHLEKHLEDLKSQRAEISSSCDRWRKKMEMAFMNE